MANQTFDVNWLKLPSCVVAALAFRPIRGLIRTGEGYLAALVYGFEPKQ